MYPVKQDFKDNIYAPSRMTKGRVTFDISDTSIAKDTITTTTTNQFSLSDKTQLTDKVRDNSYNYATLENNRFKLDGSFSFADDTLEKNGHVGWCSDDLCDGQGVFLTPPQINFDFGLNHSSIGFTITFDTLNNEYATEFDVKAYDSLGTLITTTTVTDNTEVQLASYGQFYDYRRIEVVIKKWNKPFRRARVVEVDFGVVKVYTDDHLILMSLIEEVDLTTGTIPSPEFKFTVDNSDRGFNILNPSGFYKSLQQRQQVIAEIGLDINNKIEYVPLGNYLLWEWNSDEGSLTATFLARTNLDVMSTFDYENLVAKSNYSLFDMAVEVFEYSGIDNYSIDKALNDIPTNGLVKKNNCLTILQMIAIASCSNVFVTRNNVITLKVNSIPTTADDLIDLDNMYSEPKIELDKIVKSVNVAYYDTIDTSNTVTVNNSGISSGDSLKVDNITLINTSERASVVAQWILNQKNNRSIYTLNWRGNPALELKDWLAIQNSYGSNMNAYVTKNELTYQGYLTGRMEARGEAN